MAASCVVCARGQPEGSPCCLQLRGQVGWPGDSQGDDSSWDLVTAVVMLSPSPPGLCLPAEGVRHAASWRLHPASHPRPPVHPLLGHCHLPVLRPARPHC